MSEASQTRLFFEHALLPQGWATRVAIDVRGGEIVSVEPDAGPSDRQLVSGIALPGMPNVHSHAFQRGMAGLTERRGAGSDSFWSWRELMYRFLGEITPDDVEALAAQAYVEMLEAGYTSVGEFHYLHHDREGRPYANRAEMAERVTAAAEQTGIGVTLIPTLYAHSSFGGAPPNEGQRRFLNDGPGFLNLVEKARSALRALPSAAMGVAPHSLRAVSPSLMQEILPEFRDGPIHIHAAEQVKEVEDCLAWSGLRPVEWLLENVTLDRRWCLIHATHMTEAETHGLAASGAVAGLCPITEANLGDGIFNGVTYRAAGGRFAIGTDSNVEITAAGELKQLEYSQRLGHRMRNAMALGEGESTGRLLYDATLSGGGQALGRAIGALAPGCRADIVVLSRGRPEMAAVEGDSWLDQFIFVQGSRLVDTVFVGGRRVVENGIHFERDRVAARFARVFARLAAA